MTPKIEMKPLEGLETAVIGVRKFKDVNFVYDSQKAIDALRKNGMSMYEAREHIIEHAKLGAVFVKTVNVKAAVSAALKLELSLRMAKERAERQSEIAAANIALLQVDLKSAWSKVAEAAQHAQEAIA